MIAHSLKGPVFGPAQNLHGATYVVDMTFFRESLDPDNIVVDIGLATETLKRILHPLNYANLDDLPALAGQLTTTEFLCRYVFDLMADAIGKGELGPHAGGIDRLRVTLNESHIAKAWYEAALG
jgi:6-pyruvoyl-tetrahydropterin synthase